MANLESAVINVKTAIAGALVVFGSIFSGAWFAAEASEKLKQAEELASKNATAVADLVQVLGTVVATQSQNQTVITEAAKDARTNREALIRIEAKLEAQNGR